MTYLRRCAWVYCRSQSPQEKGKLVSSEYALPLPLSLDFDVLELDDDDLDLLWLDLSLSLSFLFPLSFLDLLSLGPAVGWWWYALFPVRVSRWTGGIVWWW